MRRIMIILIFIVTVIISSGCTDKIERLITDKQYEDAAALLETEVRLNPENTVRLKKLLLIYNDNLDDFKSGAYAAYGYMKRNGKAENLADISKILFRNYANELISGEYPDSALFFSKLAIIIDSAYASAYLIAGKAYVKLAMPDSGRIYIQRALSIDSNLLDGYIYLGNIAVLDDNIREGEQCYIRALKRDSLFANAWKNLGILYYNTQNYGESMTCFKKAVLINPKDIIPYDYIISMFSSAGLSDSAFAYMEMYEKATGISLKVEL